MASQMLTTRQVAERLNVAPSTVSAHAGSGDIPGAAKVFGRWRFDEQWLEAWIASKAARDPWAAPPRSRLSR